MFTMESRILTYGASGAGRRDPPAPLLSIVVLAVPDQMGAVSAYEETRDYSLCRKAIDEITDRWIKYGTQDFWTNIT